MLSAAAAQPEQVAQQYRLSAEEHQILRNAVLDSAVVVRQEPAQQVAHKPLFEDMIAKHPGLREELAQIAEQPAEEGGDASAATDATNAVLASRYFDLLRVVEAYEKHGVTCQTYRHFVDAPCAECNCTAPQTAIKPMTRERIKAAAKDCWADDLDDFSAGVRFAERFHNIKE